MVRREILVADRAERGAVVYGVRSRGGRRSVGVGLGAGLEAGDGARLGAVLTLSRAGLARSRVVRALSRAGREPNPLTAGRRSAGPNTMVPLAGRCRSAVVQSVGAGCWAGATPSIQIRHLPAGGTISRGTTGALRVVAGAGAGALDCATSNAGDITSRTVGRTLGSDIRTSDDQRDGMIPAAAPSVRPVRTITDPRS